MGKGAYRVLVGKREGNRSREDPGVDGKILKWICKECDKGHELDCSSSEQGQVASSYGCGNEPLDSIKCGEFLD